MRWDCVAPPCAFVLAGSDGGPGSDVFLCQAQQAEAGSRTAQIDFVNFMHCGDDSPCSKALRDDVWALGVLGGVAARQAALKEK